MDTTFFLKLPLSFLIGGSWAIFATYIADKLGAKIGGLIAGLPSTLLFGLLFIGWTQSPSAAAQATTIVPIIGGISAIFLAIFSNQKTDNFGRAITTSLGIWAILAYMAFRLSPNFTESLIAFFILLSSAYLFVEKVIKVETVKGNKVVYSPRLLVFRGLLSGSVISFAVLMGKMGGPILGGLFSMFPAMFTSTLAIAFQSHGAKFARSLAKSALLSSVSIVAFATMVRYTYPQLGLVLGTLLSSLFSIITAWAIYQLLISKSK